MPNHPNPFRDGFRNPFRDGATRRTFGEPPPEMRDIGTLETWQLTQKGVVIPDEPPHFDSVISNIQYASSTHRTDSAWYKEWRRTYDDVSDSVNLVRR